MTTTINFTGTGKAQITEGDTIRLGSVHTYTVLEVAGKSLTLAHAGTGRVQTVKLAGTVNGAKVN